MTLTPARGGVPGVVPALTIFFRSPPRGIQSRTKTALREVQSQRAMISSNSNWHPCSRSSRRETPINRTTRYLGASRYVKAILPRFIEVPAQHRRRCAASQPPGLTKECPEATSPKTNSS